MCGIVGVYGKDASIIAHSLLFALQARGQESVGIASWNAGDIKKDLRLGLINQYTKSDLKNLPGFMAVGHNRYSTTGPNDTCNIQPLVINSDTKESMAIAHNGNIPNSKTLRNDLESKGSRFFTTSDTEIIADLIYRSNENTIEDKIADSLNQIKGAYSLSIMTDKKIIGAVDPNNWHPLNIGKLDGNLFLSSETTSFNKTGAEFIRSVNPGEIVVIDQDGIKSIDNLIKSYNGKESRCIFEFIYLSMPDSNNWGESVSKKRKELGKKLAEKHPVEADVVVPVPDSGNVGALGYSQESNIPLEFGIIRNHYSGRTFIEPKDREAKVRRKFSVDKNVVEDKRVVLIDDSIVRANTSRVLTKMMWDNGAKEVHLRIYSPMYKHPCFYGIDTPHKDELIAATHNIDQIRGLLGVNTIEYLTVDELLEVFHPDQDKYCTACFNGNFPVPINGNE